MKLSIITINLNKKDGLQKTIDSVVSQTFKDFEWIVIDGGSTDGSKELLEQYTNYFAYWVSEPDKGIYNAMNKGIKVAKGEYLQFLNSGDCLVSPTILSEVFLGSHNADVLYGLMVRNNVGGKMHNMDLMKPNLFWYDFYFGTLNHQSTFIKLHLFEEAGGYDESYVVMADWHFFARVLGLGGASYEFLPIVISVYEGGGFSETSDRWTADLLRLREELYPNNIVERGFKIMTDYNELIAPYWIPRVLYKSMKRLMRLYNKLFKSCKSKRS